MFALVLFAGIVIVLSGILSLIEASLFSYTFAKAELQAARGVWGAKRALALRKKPLPVIATFVILSTTVSTVGSILVGSYAAKLFSSEGIGIFSAILTFCVIIFSEIIPKNIGERWSHIIFPLVATPLYGLSLVLKPIIIVLEFVMKPFTTGVSPFTTSEEEIAILSDVGAKEGTIEVGEAEMIKRIFRLNDVTAGDMMTPRFLVSFVDGAKTIRDLAEFIKENTHSRLPVFEGGENNIIGIVHQRDLLKALAIGEFDRKVGSYAREAMIIPESRLADDLLRDFQTRRTHLAVVVNERGDVAGVVGLEDVLEELVGEIIDEKDVAPELIKRLTKNTILVHGQTPIASVNQFFNLKIDSHKTINGFLLEKLGRIPEQGETLELEGVSFFIESASRRQVDKVRIMKKADDHL